MKLGSIHVRGIAINGIRYNWGIIKLDEGVLEAGNYGAVMAVFALDCKLRQVSDKDELVSVVQDSDSSESYSTASTGDTVQVTMNVSAPSSQYEDEDAYIDTGTGYLSSVSNEIMRSLWTNTTVSRYEHVHWNPSYVFPIETVNDLRDSEVFRAMSEASRRISRLVVGDH